MDKNEIKDYIEKLKEFEQRAPGEELIENEFLNQRQGVFSM
jgi:hypothetical protein